MEIQFEQVDAEELKRRIQIRDALQRLMQNQDWQTVIEQEYLVNYTSSVMLALADISHKDPLLRKQFKRLAEAPGYLQRFLNYVVSEGDEAERALNEDYMSDHESSEDYLQ